MFILNLHLRVLFCPSLLDCVIDVVNLILECDPVDVTLCDVYFPYPLDRPSTQELYVIHK